MVFVFFISPDALIKHYICIKFDKNISKGFKAMKPIQAITISKPKFTKCHNSIKMLTGVTMLVLCTFLILNALYLYQV